MKLAKYDAACRAVAEAKSVDEVKDIRDKSEAMRAYARQAKNKDLELNAAEIRIRAERRLGEIIQLQKETVGLATGGDAQRTRVGKGPESPPTLSEAGIDKHLADTARKYAAVPEDQFEGMIGEWRSRVTEENKRVTTKLIKSGEDTIAKETRETDSKFNRTTDSIEWAKWTWNPVTGCKFNCPYCYARDIGKRFTGHFDPTFHKGRLSAPRNTRSMSDGPGEHNVFVCSMADLFGDWVPQVWIDAVLKSVRESPDWTFLFLTKNPSRLVDIEWPGNAWVGTTVDTQARVNSAEDSFKKVKAKVKFVSLEPLKEKIVFPHPEYFNWFIIGGQSASSGEPAFQPEWGWVESIVSQARSVGAMVYFKPNLETRPKEYPS